MLSSTHLLGKHTGYGSLLSTGVLDKTRTGTVAWPRYTGYAAYINTAIKELSIPIKIDKQDSAALSGLFSAMKGVKTTFQP